MYCLGMKGIKMLGKWLILLVLTISVSQARSRCIQEECTEWIYIEKPCGTKQECHMTNGKEVCHNVTMYCKVKYSCAQRKCTKWEKVLEKIDDYIEPIKVRPPADANAIRG